MESSIFPIWFPIYLNHFFRVDGQNVFLGTLLLISPLTPHPRLIKSVSLTESTWTVWVTTIRETSLPDPEHLHRRFWVAEGLTAVSYWWAPHNWLFDQFCFDVDIDGYGCNFLLLLFLMTLFLTPKAPRVPCGSQHHRCLHPVLPGNHGLHW